MLLQNKTDHLVAHCLQQRSYGEEYGEIGYQAATTKQSMHCVDNW